MTHVASYPYCLEFFFYFLNVFSQLHISTLRWFYDEFYGLAWLTKICFLFYFNFILLHWVDWELNFRIFFWFHTSYFDFFSNFIQSPHPRNKWTWVDSDNSFSPFLFDFIIQNWVDWRLSGFYDLSNRFDKLTQVDLSWSNMLLF